MWVWGWGSGGLNKAGLERLWQMDQRWGETGRNWVSPTPLDKGQTHMEGIH